MIQPDILSRFSQPVHFPRFKPDNLLLFKHCKIFRLQPGKICRLTEPEKKGQDGSFYMYFRLIPQEFFRAYPINILKPYNQSSLESQ